MTFESELERGRLVVPRCPECGAVAWPPSDFCGRCLRPAAWEDAPREGTVLEFSRQDGRYFCVADMGGSFRILCGVASGTPARGSRVELERCGIRDGKCFFEVRVLGGPGEDVRGVGVLVEGPDGGEDDGV